MRIVEIFFLADARFQALIACRPEQQVFFPNSSASIGPRTLHDDCNGSETAIFWRIAVSCHNGLLIQKTVCQWSG